jgi:hypothetical protein
MKLSEQINRDFLSEDNRPETVHKVSRGYLIELIYKVHVLEERIKELELCLEH